MPEGDTVYATAHRLTEALGGVTLVRADLRHPRLSTVDLTGRVFERAVSVGKHLFLRFGGELSLHCHLGMDGSWRVYTGRAPVTYQTRAVLGVPGKTAVGNLLLEMALLSTPDEHRLVDHLGPDLLSPDWSDADQAEAVRRLTADPSRGLGEALLDQTVMAGVGNVFKVELCFLLRVTPWTPVSDVDAEKVVRWARKLLLANRLNPVRNTTGDPRRGRSVWVYGRRRQGCLRCGGPVVYTPGDRISYHCPRCQQGPGPS